VILILSVNNESGVPESYIYSTDKLHLAYRKVSIDYRLSIFMVKLDVLPSMRNSKERDETHIREKRLLGVLAARMV